MKTRNTTRLRLSLAVALCVFCSGVTQPANAQFVPPLELPDQPLFLNLSVPPASIMLGLDNSGSMRFSLIRLPSVANYLTSVIGANKNSDPSDYIISGNDSYDELAEKLSVSCPGANLLAYNPAVTYEPWPSLPQSPTPEFTNRAVNSAQHSDPGYEATFQNVRDNIIVTWEDDGDGVFDLSNTAWNPATDDLDGNGVITLLSPEQVEYDPEVEIAECAFPPTLTPRGSLQGTGTSAIAERQEFIEDAEDAGRISYVRELTPAEQRNYANWYTYHRIPLLLLKNAVLNLIRDDADYRMGIIPMYNITDFFLYRGANPAFPRNPYYPPPAHPENFAVSLGPMDSTAHKQNVYNALKNIRIDTFGVSDTPIRRLLQRIGLYFDYTFTRTNASSLPPSSKSAEIVSIGSDFWKNGNVPIGNAYLPDSEGGSCQRNFALIFSDGVPEETVNDVGLFVNHTDFMFRDFVGVDADGDGDTPYDDGPHKDNYTVTNPSDINARTLADIAMHFYERDLHPGLDDNVPPSEYVDPSNNITYTSNNPAQHLVTYIVGFGGASTLGLVPQLDPLPPDRMATTSPTWPRNPALIEGPYDNNYVRNRTPQQRRALIHDLQHAAFNSRGLFLSAEDSTSLNATLQQIVDQIKARSGLSGSAPAQNSAFLQSTSRIFQALFNSGEWSGELTASSLNSRGEIDQEVWRATDYLQTGSVTAANYNQRRNIFTGIPAAGGRVDGARFTDTPIPFGLSFTLPQGVPLTTSGSDVIRYIAGVQDREGAGANNFRQRNTLLGDIVSSSPISVGYVDYNYDRLGVGGADYPDFLVQKRLEFTGSDTVIYVGANDGMLHAFHDTADPNDADAGKELFAYIPSALWTAPSNSDNPKSNIVDLLDRGYNHKFYVNGEQSVGDAYVCDSPPCSCDIPGTPCSWKSILVGGLGEGAKGVYALDVTNPFSFDANDVLWEYEPDNAPPARVNARNVGYVKHAPVLARLNNGDWGVIFGGYSNISEPALFILDAATGDEIAVISSNSVDVGDGFARPLVVDEDGDLIADRVYAGTLASGLYKFDISSADEADWKSVYSGAFFEPKDTAGNIQPIVTQPAIAVNPEGGFNLIVGTGKYLEDTDLDAPYQVQSLYSIRDDDLDNDPASRVLDPRSLSPKRLQEQEFLHEIDFTRNGEPQTARIHSTNTIDYSASPPIKGWYLDLITPARTESDGQITPARTESDGERVVSRPMVRGENAIFTLFTPTPSYCGEGRDNSFFFEIDALTGARLEDSVFDVNGDGVIDSDDFLEYGGMQVPVSGLSIPGTLSSPAVISLDTPGQEVKISLGIGGETTSVLESATTAITGRQSWRQLR